LPPFAFKMAAIVPIWIWLLNAVNRIGIMFLGRTQGRIQASIHVIDELDLECPVR
jgi:hypothetical protein